LIPNTQALKTKLATVDRITGLKNRLEAGWLKMPEALPKSLAAFTATLNAKPDQSATRDAQTFLTTAQIRLGDYREGMRNNKAADVAKTSAKAAYDTYCAVLEEELNALYDEVQKDFSTFYRAINEDDESKFTAKFTPSEGSLGLDVNFYERGLFPPAAYHSRPSGSHRRRQAGLRESPYRFCSPMEVGTCLRNTTILPFPRMPLARWMSSPRFGVKRRC
jgi:hypothetical protein